MFLKAKQDTNVSRELSYDVKVFYLPFYQGFIDKSLCLIQIFWEKKETFEQNTF